MTSDPFYKDLNPISFLDRSAHVYPDKPALSYGDITHTYQDFYNRVNKLAGALQKEGIKKEPGKELSPSRSLWSIQL